MIEIKDLLVKLSTLLVSKEDKKESVRSIISEAVGVTIKKSDIEIKNNTVYLNIKPIYKNEILMKRDYIFSQLRESLGKKAPEDIR